MSKENKWQEELDKLRSVICKTGLTETIKWGGAEPDYTINTNDIS